ncbi:MAG: hypothetical protein FJ100_22325 [Deltaproteobacteria bacterium]|nr:hypothetical protein [Deltaproteobacteria bacterium]
MRFSFSASTVFFAATLAGCALWVATAPRPAAAASRGHLNRCSDAVREIRGGTPRTFETRDIDPSEVESAISHINQHTERLNRAQRMMDSAGPWEASDPALAECVELMNKSRAYIASTQAKIRAAQASEAQQAPVLAAAKGENQRRVFFMLATIHLAKQARVFENLKPAEARALVDSLAPLEPLCQQALPDAAKTAPKLPDRNSAGGSEMRTGGFALPSNLTERADWWCWLAAHRKELAVAALANVNVVAEGYGNHHMAFDEVLKKGDDWNGAGDPWLFLVASDSKPLVAGLKLALAPWYKAFEVEVPADSLAGLDDQIAKIRAAIIAAAARNPLQAGRDHDKAMESGAKAALGRIYPKVAVVASWMDAGAWTVEQNSLGIPLKRYRSGQLVYRVGSDPWCQRRTFNRVEPHMGGGKYGKAEEKLLGSSTATQCP